MQGPGSVGRVMAASLPSGGELNPAFLWKSPSQSLPRWRVAREDRGSAAEGCREHPLGTRPSLCIGRTVVMKQSLFKGSSTGTIPLEAQGGLGCSSLCNHCVPPSSFQFGVGVCNENPLNRAPSGFTVCPSPRMPRHPPGPVRSPWKGMPGRSVG